MARRVPAGDGLRGPRAGPPLHDAAGAGESAQPLGAPVSGDLLDAALGGAYDDVEPLPFPMFGQFPPGQPDPLPAPQLPNTRLRLRG